MSWLNMLQSHRRRDAAEGTKIASLLPSYMHNPIPEEALDLGMGCVGSQAPPEPFC